ncbi:BA75_00094T0 [Komagataella pastoris]|uniref:BA75_00094T0 n=1 Tax=Komagataella pastoris TaxID=4922 RepID=A0A1B2J960_PICPA|nr:BA75_00094T0 [Komagataella pastoris]
MNCSYYSQEELDYYFDEFQSSSIIESVDAYPFRLEITRSIESVLYDPQPEMTIDNVMKGKSSLTMRDILFGEKKQRLDRCRIKVTKSSTDLLRESRVDDQPDRKSLGGVLAPCTDSISEDVFTCSSSLHPLAESTTENDKLVAIDSQDTNSSNSGFKIDPCSKLCSIM